MLSKWIKPTIMAVIYVLIWIFAYYLIVAIFHDSPAKSAYGYITSWWCSLYFGYILNIKLKSIVPLMVMFVLTVSVVEIIFHMDWFYHDAPTEISVAYIILLILRFLLFASPIFINGGVRYLVGKFQKN